MVSTRDTGRRRRTTVLVVDDDDDTRRAHREILENAGFEVVEAEDGRAALDALEAGLRPNLIVTDLDMPRMNGITFRTAQLRDPRLADIPAIVVSRTAPLPLSRLRLTAMLNKPVPSEELLDAATTALRDHPSTKHRLA